MFKPRTVEEAQQDYLLAIASTDSPIELDTNQGSVIYTLSRGAASLAAAQDLRLQTLESSYLTAATGAQLDKIGLSFGLTRLQPSTAAGFVRVISSGEPSTVSPSTRLFELATGLEFSTTNTSSIQVGSLFEVAIPVTALQSGEDSNLLAGTRLYPLADQDLRFTVGQTRSTVYIGDLVGGNDLESDEEYRTRIGIKLSSKASASTSELVLKLLEQDRVDRAFVKTSVGGVVEIWVDSLEVLSSQDIANIKNVVQSFVAAGVIPVVVQAGRIKTNFELVVEPFRGTAVNLQELTPRINSIVRTVINSLSVGEPLLKSSITDAVRPFVRSVTVRNLPRLTSPGVGNILVPGDIKVVYPLSI
jgi:uncharacterized phage protein gp47/JayE